MSVIKNSAEITPIPVEMDGAKNTAKKLLLGSADGVPLFSMRIFEIGPEGNTPFHSHDFEHEIFVLEGSGRLITDKNETAFSRGSAIFIPGNEKHTLKNTGSSPLKIICMVKKEYE